MIQSNILLTDIVIPTVDNLIVTDVPDEVIIKDSDIMSTSLTIASLNSEFIPQELQISPSLLDLNTTEFNNLSNEIVVTPTIQNNGMLLNTDIPVYDNAVPTDLSLNTNSPSNSDILGSYESVNAIPSITPGSGSLFPSDPAELPQINSLFELLQYLSEIMMRFNSDPNYYMQDDFAILVKTITNALIHLYLNAPLSTGEVEGLYAALGTKVDKILGKGLSTNDLTDELKAAYDQAFLETHIHNNKSALDLVSGENTGDQDLSGLQPKETGKGLSTNDFTNLDRTKLDGIQAGAEANVNTDWNATSGDAQLLNKPNIPDITGLASETYVQNYAEPKKGTDDNYVTDIEKANLHAPHSDDQDLSGLVVKIPGYSLVADVEIAKIHLPGSDNQDLTPYETIANNNIKLAGKEPANPNIQAHIANTNNPHLTTKAQVGLGNVDNTSDINKPISSATQTALNGKQPTGTYSTDIHSNITALNAVSGTNTGDETLTSVKTKLGAATAVSDGYLKYQDWSIFNDKQPKLNGSGFVKSFSSEITYDANNYEIAFSKNTAFNKNFGTTTGTVLEGRTFGTAANNNTSDFYATGSTVANSTKWNNLSYNLGNVTSPYGLLSTDGSNVGYSLVADIKNWLGLGSSAYTNTNDHILNQNSSAQSANMWISGSIKGETLKCGEGVESNSTYKGHLTLSDIAINGPNSVGGIEFISSMSNNGYGAKLYTNNLLDQFGISTRFNTGSWTEALRISLATNSATFASTVSATQLQSTVATGTAPLTVNSTTMVSNLNANYLGSVYIGDLNDGFNNGLNNSKFKYNIFDSSALNKFPIADNANAVLSISRLSYNDYNTQLGFNSYNDAYLRSTVNGADSGWKKLYHSGNLTNTLTTNYIPKWNGSSMVNSLISDDGSDNAYYYIGDANQGGINFKKSGGTVYGKIGIEQFGVNNDTYVGSFSNNGFGLYSTGTKRLYIRNTGEIDILSTTQSTSPTTGALVTPGGIGVGGNINAGGQIISTRSADQLKLQSYTSTNKFWILGTDIGSSGANRNFTIYESDLGNAVTIIQANGNTNIGYTTDQGYKLAVNGSGYFNGNVTASNFVLSSDRTLKTNIQPIIKDYSRLSLVSFNFKDNLNELRFGTIAQDLLSNGFNEFVVGDKEGEYKVKYIDLIIAKLASAELRIKELEDKYGSR